MGLISKTSNFAHAQHFFLANFFAVVLHDYNMKLPELLVTLLIEEMS